MYGLAREEHLTDIAIVVCDCLGHGKNNNAVNLLIETAGAETNYGKTKDYSIGAGMGITQFDNMPFYDTRKRCSNSDKQRLKDNLDIDIDLVEWEHLRYNPLLSMIFTRLKYKKIPDVIPDTVEDRAEYWKKWYNSTLGKGTIAHYVQSSMEYMV